MTGDYFSTLTAKLACLHCCRMGSLQLCLLGIVTNIVCFVVLFHFHGGREIANRPLCGCCAFSNGFCLPFSHVIAALQRLHKNRKMLVRVHVWCHQTDPLCQLGPPFTRERILVKTSAVVVGIDVFDLDSWVPVKLVKHPVQVNTVRPGNIAPALYDHLDHSGMNRDVRWLEVHSGKQNLDPQLIASHRCSLTVVFFF